MDRARPAGADERQRDDHLRDGRGPGLPGAGRPVRGPDPPAGGDPDRADVPPGRLRGGQHPRPGQQHPDPGGPAGADGVGGQERHPDRGIRQAGRGAGARPVPGRHRGRPGPPAADPDDLGGLHLRRRAAGLRPRARLGDASGAGDGGVLRDDRGDRLRAAVHAGVLRGLPGDRRTGAQAAPPGRPAGRTGSGGVARMQTPLVPTLAAAAPLAGCATAPHYRAPQTPAGASGPFVAAAEPVFSPEAPPDDWWRLYQDPALDFLIAEALDNNREIAAARANLERVRAALSESRAARLPSTQLSGGSQRVRQADPAGSGFYEDTVASAGVDVAYEVDLFGRISRAVEAARADAGAAEAVLDAVRL